MPNPVVLQAFIIAAILTVDTLVVSFSLAVSKVKIPPLCAAIVAFFSTTVLAAGIGAGNGISAFIPAHLATIICHAVLIAIGCYKALEGVLKRDPQSAFILLRPLSSGRVLKTAEAFSLGAALSLDSLAAGIGIGAGGTGLLWYISFSLVLGVIFIYVGILLGKKLGAKSSFNLSWLSGAALILVGITGLI